MRQVYTEQNKAQQNHVSYICCPHIKHLIAHQIASVKSLIYIIVD